MPFYGFAQLRTLFWILWRADPSIRYLVRVDPALPIYDNMVLSISGFVFAEHFYALSNILLWPAHALPLVLRWLLRGFFMFYDAFLYLIHTRCLAGVSGSTSGTTTFHQTHLGCHPSSEYLHSCNLYSLCLPWLHLVMLQLVQLVFVNDCTLFCALSVVNFRTERTNLLCLNSHIVWILWIFIATPRAIWRFHGLVDFIHGHEMNLWCYAIQTSLRLMLFGRVCALCCFHCGIWNFVSCVWIWQQLPFSLWLCMSIVGCCFVFVFGIVCLRFLFLHS